MQFNRRGFIKGASLAAFAGACIDASGQGSRSANSQFPGYDVDVLVLGGGPAGANLLDSAHKRDYTFPA